jgi:hypothetical protein
MPFVTIENEIVEPPVTIAEDIPEGTIFTGSLQICSDKLFLKFNDGVLSLDRKSAGANNVTGAGVFGRGLSIRNYKPVKSITVTV